VGGNPEKYVRNTPAGESGHEAGQNADRMSLAVTYFYLTTFGLPMQRNYTMASQSLHYV
jgi:hypothetical protein